MKQPVNRPENRRRDSQESANSGRLPEHRATTDCRSESGRSVNAPRITGHGVDQSLFRLCGSYWIDPKQLDAVEPASKAARK